MSQVVANGLQFHVQRLGDGPPLVMLHGLLVGNLATWYFGAAPALSRQHNVMLYDLRGHGRSEFVAAGYDSATMVRDLLALTADFHNVPVTVVGHSFGGLVALRFALSHPERVQRLILVDAPLPAETGGLAPPTGDDFGTPEEMIAALPPPIQAFFKTESRQARRLLRALHRLVVDSSLVDDLRAEPAISDAALAGFAGCTQLIYGRDSYCRGDGERLARTLGNAKMRLLPGGHYLHVDCAAALTDTLVEVCDG